MPDTIITDYFYGDEGYKQAVLIDLSKYFDTLNHDLLMNMVREQVHDKRVVELIKRFLKSGIMENGLYIRTQEGSPQGGPLSPLLANIYLDFPFSGQKRPHGNAQGKGEHPRVAWLLRNCKHEEHAQKLGRMAPTPLSDVHLEAMEEAESANPRSHQARHSSILCPQMGLCKGTLASCGESCAYTLNNKRETRTSRILQPIRQVRVPALMRLNRRIGNPTYGGVRGRAPHGALLLD